MKAQVVLEDVGARDNGAKVQIALKYSHACLWTKLWKMCLWVRGSCWGRGNKLELVTKTWAHKENSSCKFSQSFARKCLSWIHVSLSPNAMKGKCPCATSLGSCTNLSNGKWNTTYMSHHRTIGMWLYNQGQWKFKWKDPRTSKDDTQI